MGAWPMVKSSTVRAALARAEAQAAAELLQEQRSRSAVGAQEQRSGVSLGDCEALR